MTDKTPPETFLFIGGPPRSGTTLLMQILNQSDSIALMQEYSLPRLLRDIEPLFAFGDEQGAITKSTSGPPKLPRNGVENTCSPSGSDQQPTRSTSGITALTYENPSSDLQSAPAWPDRQNRSAILAAIFRSSLRKPLASILGTKDPLFHHEIDLASMSELATPCRYIWIYRNPLKVINSSVNRRNRALLGIDDWKLSSINEMIAQLRRVAVKTIALIHARPTHECHVIKYEDLIADQNAIIGATQAFLGLPQTQLPQLTDPNRGIYNVCEPTELDELQSKLGPLIDAWADLSLTGPGTQALPALSRFIEPISSFPIALEIAQLGNHLGMGWSEIEQGHGAWSEGTYSSIVLPPIPAGSYTLLIDAAAFVASPVQPVKIEISVNSKVRYSCTWVSAAGRSINRTNIECIQPHEPITICLDNTELSDQEANVIEFRFIGVTSPEEAGIGADRRKLCLFLKGLRLAQATASPS